MHPSLLWPAAQPRPALRTSASPRHWPLAALALTCAMLLTACGKEQPGPGQMPPPPVGVVTVADQVVALQTELPGRVSPVRVAQVRARVNGVVLKRLFREGSEVKAGQVLYEIDAAPYRATADSAQASDTDTQPAHCLLRRRGGVRDRKSVV